MTSSVSNYGCRGAVAVGVAVTVAFITEITLEAVAASAGEAFGRCVVANNATNVACAVISVSIDSYKTASFVVDIAASTLLLGACIFVGVKSRRVRLMEVNT